MHVVVRKPLWNSKCMIVRGSSSSVECVLKYKEYALFRDIVQGNVMAPIDMDGWDNIEKAFEQNLVSAYSDDSGLSISDSSVQYVEHAKVVRYGNAAKTRIHADEKQQLDQEGNTILNVGFSILGLKLFLHRDDNIGSIDLPTSLSAEDFNYDILLLYVSRIDLSAKITLSGERVISLSLHKLGLFDLGDTGRQMRERISNPVAKPRKPCACE